MATFDLQHIVDQAAGKPIHLDPRDSFEIQSPSLKPKGQIELYGHGATLQHDRRWPRKSAPLVSGTNVTGIIDGLVLVGTKDPAQGYVAAREGHAGFWFMGAQSLRIRDCQVLHVAGDFAYFGALKTGRKAAGTLAWKPCRLVWLERLVGIDAGRHAIAAVGVESLGIDNDCTFLGWQRQKVDRENMNGYHTQENAVFDAGATWVKVP